MTRLWGELSEFSASQAVQAGAHCYAGLARIIGGANVFWVGAARTRPRPGDMLGGWRPCALARLHDNPEYDRRLADSVREMDAHLIDPMTLANNQHVGRTRAFLRSELVADEPWERSAMVSETMRPLGLSDRLIAAAPVGVEREVHIGIDRQIGDRSFGERERDLLNLFLLGSRAFQQEQFLAQAGASPALTPREHEVMALLLTDMSEREIGEELGLTYRTVHQYAVSIFKKYGVRGRLGLMALWLRRGTPAP